MTLTFGCLAYAGWLAGWLAGGMEPASGEPSQPASHSANRPACYNESTAHPAGQPSMALLASSMRSSAWLLARLLEGSCRGCIAELPLKAAVVVTLLPCPINHLTIRHSMPRVEFPVLAAADSLLTGLT